MSIHYIAKLVNGGVMMGFLVKFGTGVKRIFVSIIEFIRDGFKELRKVRWPDRKELTSYTTIVIGTVVLLAVFFFVVDLGISSLLKLFGIGS